MDYNMVECRFLSILFCKMCDIFVSHAQISLPF